MKLTNDLALPEPIVRAIQARAYSKGDADYSVTELLAPPRAKALERANRDRLVEDVADNIYSLVGTIGHGILERSGAPETGAILEERLYMDIDGVRISGAMDHTLLLPTGVIDDYKFTSVWQVKNGCKPEWTQQLNVYALLRAANGQIVTGLRIVAILRDWTAPQAARSTPDKYPPRQVVVFDVELWPLERTREFLCERIALHQAADGAVESGLEPYPCSDDERWVRDRAFAVMKPGRKSAVRVYDSLGEAQLHAESIPGGTVEPRGGEPTRCLYYCTVGKAGLCSQFNAERATAPWATGRGESAGEEVSFQ